jgi:hypothetical protein
MDPSEVTVESWEAAGQTILWNLKSLRWSSLDK